MSKTKEESMCLSHSRRFASGPMDYPRFRTGDYQVRSTENELRNGVIVKKSVWKTVHPADNFAGMRASDFALENVIAVGALDSLRECKLNFNSSGEVSDNIEPSIDAAISALNVAEAQNQPTNE